jgi:hypothetical protein
MRPKTWILVGVLVALPMPLLACGGVGGLVYFARQHRQKTLAREAATFAPPATAAPKEDPSPSLPAKQPPSAAKSKLPDVPGYDFKAAADETLTVKSWKENTPGTYYEVEFTNKKGGSRRYVIEMFQNGKPFSIEVFWNNQPVESKAWWSNGERSLSTSWRDFAPSGTWEFWNNKGELIGKVEFGAGRPKLLTWDKEQMTILAMTNNFYADTVTVVLEVIRK